MKTGRCYLLLAALVAVLPFSPLSAQAEEGTATSLQAAERGIEEETPLELSVSVGTAYYFASEHSTKGVTTFSGISGAYDGFELGVTGEAVWTVPFLRADNFLMEENYASVAAALQVSPVTFTPSIKVTVSPLAVLEVSAGAVAGTGWFISGMEVQGAGEYNRVKACYETIDPFSQWYLKAYAGATLMFDVGAVWEGDWHHIVMTASGEAGYQKLTGTSGVWQWQACRYPMANGWVYTHDYFIGYQMPLALSLVGVDVSFYGHFNESDFDAGGIAESYDGDFVMIDITPVAQLKLDEKGRDTIFMFASISSRRSFKEEWKDWDSEPLMTKNGREFFFQSIGLQWKHIF